MPWKKMGSALEDLLRYERQIGHYEHASYDLLSTLANGAKHSPWRRFLLEGDNCSTVVDQILALSRRDGRNPKAVLESTRDLVETACARNAQGAFALLGSYLRHRPSLPEDVRAALDAQVKAGDDAIPRLAIDFATELERLSGRGQDNVNDAQRDVLDYWYREIARGQLTSDQARGIPARVFAAKNRLLSHLREIEGNDSIDEEAVYDRYSRVLKSRDIPKLVDTIIGLDRIQMGFFQEQRRFQIKLDVEQIELLLRSLSKEEVMRRFERLAEWLAEVNGQNHDGVILTPVLVNHLSRQEDFESLLGELERLRNETRNGRFHVDNPLQRDLEYCRFATEHSWQYGGLRDTPEQYAIFKGLQELPPPHEEEVVLSEEHILQARRTAYEALGFLRFLREFRSKTGRPIVVVGNDRYGRVWVVEPLEDHLLKDGFALRYDRVPSHKSMRLSVRHELRPFHIRLGFPRDFVIEMSKPMPHIVIVDARNPQKHRDKMKFSRGQRDYVNWLIAFNDIRAEGDGSKYDHESSLPPNHFAELKKWHEFEVVRRQLRDWVNPGPTYKIVHWAPVLTEDVLLGDFVVPRRDVEFGSDRPQVVLANATVVRTDGDDLPDALRGNRPYYFNDPEKMVKETVVFGFGSYGFETRVVGTTTDTFIAAVQRQIKAEIERMLKDSSQSEATPAQP